MKVTATKLANDSKAVLDQVHYKGHEIIVQRHGKPVAAIRPYPGVGAKEMLEILQRNPLTPEEARELYAATKEGAKALHGNGH